MSDSTAEIVDAGVTQQPPESADGGKTPQQQEGDVGGTPEKGDTPTGEVSGDVGDKPAVLGAPEAYEFSKPEGLIGFDDEVMAIAKEVFRDLDLSQHAGQQVIDRIGLRIVERTTAAMAEQQQRTLEEWRAELAADPELGRGDPEALKSVKAAIARTVNLGGPELRSWLDETGLGDNPMFARWAYRVGKALSEDTFMGGNDKADPRPRSAASRLYNAK